MKTTLAIALAAAALMFGATASLTSGAAIAGYDVAGYDTYSGKSIGRCGVLPCPTQQQTPKPSGKIRGR
jgi:hypothetical protein